MGFADRIRAGKEYLDKKSQEFEQRSQERDKKTLAKLKRQAAIEQQRAKIRMAQNRGNVNRAGRSENPFGGAVGPSTGGYNPVGTLGQSFGWDREPQDKPKKKKKGGRSVTIKFD